MGFARGQFLVMASLFLSLILFSLALIISNVVQTNRTTASRTDIEVVENLSDDFPRALAEALAIASQARRSGQPYNNSRKIFLEYMENWRTAFFEAYSGGFWTNLSAVNGASQCPEISWNTTSGVSSANMLLKANLTTKGLEGWATTEIVMLKMTLNTTSFIADSQIQKTNFSLIISGNYGDPIPFGLTKPGAEFLVWYWNYTSVPQKWEPANFNCTGYVGEGRYIICLNDYITTGIKLLVYFRDKRGIIVMASAQKP